MDMMIIENLKRNPYNTISEVHKLFGLKKVSKTEYCGLFHTGTFDELYDYNKGILFVNIKYFTLPCRTVYFTISNVDVVNWIACRHEDSEEKCLELLENLYIDLQIMNTLPTAAELNNILVKRGMYGLC